MWFVTRQEVVITQKKKAAASALFLSSFFWCAVRCERVALYFVHWTAPQHGGDFTMEMLRTVSLVILCLFFFFFWAQYERGDKEFEV